MFVSKPLNIIFAGTPEFAALHLHALLKSHHNVIAVLTQPDRPAGRGNKITESAVKQLAKQYNIPIYQPASLRKPENQAPLRELNADLMVVVAYGLILPRAVLEIPRLGCMNVHGSLLPRWRGAAPIQRACWAGDTETGVTIMQLDEGMDTGDMLYKVACPILPTDTSASLYEKLAQMGPNALLKTLDDASAGALKPEKQNNALATHAAKLSKEEAKLDWHLSAAQLERCIRAFNPWPVSYFTLNDHLIKVWQASVLEMQANHKPGTIIAANKSGIQIATIDGILNITQLQLAGKKAMSAQDLLNARQDWFIPGQQLQ